MHLLDNSVKYTITSLLRLNIMACSFHKCYLYSSSQPHLSAPLVSGWLLLCLVCPTGLFLPSFLPNHVAHKDTYQQKAFCGVYSNDGNMFPSAGHGEDVGFDSGVREEVVYPSAWKLVETQFLFVVIIVYYSRVSGSTTTRSTYIYCWTTDLCWSLLFLHGLSPAGDLLEDRIVCLIYYYFLHTIFHLFWCDVYRDWCVQLYWRPQRCDTL